MGITEEQASIKRGNTEGAVWKWLSEVVKELGPDGMSSDESDEEDLMPVFRVKPMPWRRDISKELQIIDSHSKKGVSMGPKAAKRVKALRSTSNRKAAEGLPKSFYHDDWLAHNPNSASDTTFPWMNIVSQ